MYIHVHVHVRVYAAWTLIVRCQHFPVVRDTLVFIILFKHRLGRLHHTPLPLKTRRLPTLTVPSFSHPPPPLTLHLLPTSTPTHLSTPVSSRQLRQNSRHITLPSRPPYSSVDPKIACHLQTKVQTWTLHCLALETPPAQCMLR